jgi:alkylhydroperoxidase family enzyme
MTATAAAPRIAPLQPPYQPDVEASLRKWMPPGSPLEPLILFRTLAVNQELSSRMRVLGAGILGHGVVAAREREIIIHRTCARAGAEYEWGVHSVAFGRPLGLSDEQLASTVHGSAGDPVWSDTDALLIRLADELHDTCGVSDELWSRLAARYSAQQLLELITIAGWYRLIACLINGVQIQSEPWAPGFPADARTATRADPGVADPPVRRA